MNANQGEASFSPRNALPDFNPRAELNSFPQEGEARLLWSVYVPLVRFSHFVRYQEKRNTTSWTVFLIPRALRKTKNGSCFVFRFSH